MFIIAGSRRTESPQGYVAAICGQCLEITAQRVIELREVSHLYFVPVGRARVLGTERCCTVCSWRGGTEPEQEFTELVPKAAPLAVLIARTNPGVEDELIALLERHQRVADGTAEPEERVQSLLDVFGRITGAAQQRAATVHFDPWSALILLVMVMLLVIFIAGALALPPRAPMKGAFALGALVTGLGGLCTLVISLATDARRYFRRVLLPRVIEWLDEIDPSEAELHDVAMILGAEKQLIAKSMRPASIRAAIVAHRDAARDSLTADGNESIPRSENDRSSGAHAPKSR